MSLPMFAESITTGRLDLVRRPTVFTTFLPVMPAVPQQPENDGKCPSIHIISVVGRFARDSKKSHHHTTLHGS